MYISAQRAQESAFCCARLINVDSKRGSLIHVIVIWIRNLVTLSGAIGVFIGYILFALLIDFISKPSNVSLAFKPIDSLQIYFFGFVFTMGSIGWVLASLLLIGFLVLFYFIGTWIYKTVIKK